MRQFYALRRELIQREVERTALKPIRRELTDIIQATEGGDKWAYKKYTDLAYKSSVGKNAAQLRTGGCLLHDCQRGGAAAALPGL